MTIILSPEIIKRKEELEAIHKKTPQEIQILRERLGGLQRIPKHWREWQKKRLMEQIQQKVDEHNKAIDEYNKMKAKYAQSIQ